MEMQHRPRDKGISSRRMTNVVTSDAAPLAVIDAMTKALAKKEPLERRMAIVGALYAEERATIEHLTAKLGGIDGKK
jgi:hypothetical protein